MDQSSEHKTESRWRVLQRCLTIVRRTQQGGAKRNDLLSAVYQTMGDDAYGNTTGSALTKRFDRDRASIREKLGIELRYERGHGYVIRDWGTSLFDLPDADIKSLAYLATLFVDNTPHSQ